MASPAKRPIHSGYLDQKIENSSSHDFDGNLSSHPSYRPEPIASRIPVPTNQCSEIESGPPMSSSNMVQNESRAGETLLEVPGVAHFAVSYHKKASGGSRTVVCRLRPASALQKSVKERDRRSLTLDCIGDLSADTDETIEKARRKLRTLLVRSILSFEEHRDFQRERSNLLAINDSALGSLRGWCEAARINPGREAPTSVYVGVELFESGGGRPAVGWATWQIVSEGQVIASALAEDLKAGKELIKIPRCASLVEVDSKNKSDKVSLGRHIVVRDS